MRRTLLALTLALTLEADALTLREAIALALDRHPDLVVERVSLEVAEATLLRAEAAYEPTLRADVRLRERTDPVNSILSGAPRGEFAPTLRTWGTSASFGGLLPTGATYSLLSTLQHDSTNSVLALLTPSWTTVAGVEVRQPLAQNRRIDPARRAIRVARADRERALTSVERAASEVVAAVERAWWGVVAARRDEETRRNAVALAGRLGEDTRVRIEGGTQSPAELAQAQAELERRRGELIAASEQRMRAENALRSLLAADAGDPRWGEPLELADDESDSAAASLAENLRLAELHRPELRELASRLERHDAEIAFAADRLRPQLDLVVSYVGRGLGGSPNEDAIEPFGPVVVPGELRGGFGASMETLMQNEFPDASIGIAVAIPVGNGAARQDVAIARAVRRQTEAVVESARRRVVLEVRNAWAALESARERMAVARRAREAAEVQLQAERDREEGGASTTYFVLTRQNELAAAQVAETLALADYRRAESELARASGTLLGKRAVDVF